VRSPGVTPRAGTETLGGARTGSVPCLLLRCLRLAVQQREDASVTPPRTWAQLSQKWRALWLATSCACAFCFDRPAIFVTDDSSVVGQC
jgi:hypothetical protein